MNNLFAMNMEESQVSNQMEKTAQLTTQSGLIANDILKAIAYCDEENRPTIEELVRQSMNNHEKMDDIIMQLADLRSENVDYLRKESSDTIYKMIKSQQSKRSRSKGKLMTMDNYRTMLIGAIAENLLRVASGKSKYQSSTGANEDALYSDEELQKLAMNHQEIARIIRNWQSKKSIMKQKKDFYAENPRWLHILAVEEQLKNARDGVTSKSFNNAVVLKLRTALSTVTNVSDLKGKDAAAMLQQMLDIMNSTEG